MKNCDLDPMEQGRSKASGPDGRGWNRADWAKCSFSTSCGRSLADKLSQAVADGTCSSLVVVAPPHFLGHVRGRPSDHAGKCLAATVDKDYAGSDARELAARLDEIAHAEHAAK